MGASNGKVFIYYIHEPEPAKDIWLCRIAQSCYEKGKTVFLLCESADHACGIDDKLWTFEQSSFVPHERIEADDYSGEAPVVIGSNPDQMTDADVLINAHDLREESRKFLRRYPVIVDFADLWDDRLRRKSRERYKILNSIDYELVTIENPSAR